jgi:hypothetical protein
MNDRGSARGALLLACSWISSLFFVIADFFLFLSCSLLFVSDSD